MSNQDYKLSASTYKAFRECPKKIAHKLAKTPRDPATSDSYKARDVGSVIHRLLEMKAIEPKTYLDYMLVEHTITEMLKDFKIQTNLELADRYTIMVAAHIGYKYLDYLFKAGYEIVGAEIPIEDQYTKGYVDLVLKDPVHGDIIVADWKTVSSFGDDLSGWETDAQILHYANFYKGCKVRIIQILKVNNALKDDECPQDYIDRMLAYKAYYGKQKGLKRELCRIIDISPSTEHVETFAGIFRQAAALIREMPSNPDEVEGNCEACIHPIYKSKCDYYGSCHKGETVPSVQWYYF
jgi:hypothetical protein